MKNSIKLKLNIRRIERAEQAQNDIEGMLRPLIEKWCNDKGIVWVKNFADLETFIGNDGLVHFKFNEYWQGDVYDTISGHFDPDWLDDAATGTVFVKSVRQERENKIQQSIIDSEKREWERLNKIYGIQV
jgi:hypothetical protein